MKLTKQDIKNLYDTINDTKGTFLKIKFDNTVLTTNELEKIYIVEMLKHPRITGWNFNHKESIIEIDLKD